MSERDQSSNYITYDAPVRELASRSIASISRAAAAQYSLPNLLLMGPSGCGKSHVARFIASHANIAHVTICGGDLLALGAGAGSYIRRLLDDCGRARKSAAIVVIDEADGILVNRKQFVDGQGVILVNPSLYSILEATRCCSNRFSLILTTRLSVEEIDPALLDRHEKYLPFSK